MKRSALAEVWPLSPLQEGLLFHALYDEESSNSYVVQRILDLSGPLDPRVLRASGQALLDRHANLRAGFRQAAGMGQPVQVIPRRVALPWQEVDLSAWPEEAALEEVSRRAAEDRAQGFDPGVPPLIRFMLIRLGPRSHRLVITNHHLLMDGWSLPVMRRELTAINAAGGDASGLKPVRPYRDYLEWLGRQDRDEARTAWRQELQGLDEPTLVASADLSQALTDAAELDRVRVIVPLESSEALRAFARGRGLTLNTVVQGAWAMVVSRLAGRGDVVFGAVVAGRPPELAGVEDMLGLFVNTVPVRVSLDPARPVVEMLADLQERQSALLAHQYLGLAEIQRAAGAGAGFDTLLTYENYPRDPARTAAPGHDELRIVPAGSEEEVHYPVSLSVNPGDELHLRLDCRRDVFDQQTAAELADRFLRVLDAITGDPTARVGRLGVLDEVERLRVVREWNDTACDVPDVTVPELFEARVAESPDAVALVFEGREVSYAELDAAVNRLAWRLIDLGVGPEKFVAVAVPRSAELIVALLAVLKAGGAYLPIDPDYPASRLGLILADADPAVVLCTAETVDVLPETAAARLLVDDAGAVEGCPESSPGRRVALYNPAYVIYTSGSTGVPKGVVVPHAGMVNGLSWVQEGYALGGGDRVLQKTPSGFDVSVWEFFWPLTVGAGLVVARPGGHRDPAYLAELIGAQKVTTAYFVPSMLRLFLEDDAAASCTGLMRVICSGEALPGELVERFQAVLPNVELHNFYGPTEASVHVSYWACPPGMTGSVVPIGAPISNIRFYVLDSFLQPVPPGVVGDLYIAGVGLARGYLNRRGLTGGRFVACPFGGLGERMYRTGDIARWTSDGQVVYLGRVDAQVKVRGLRIELGEIEVVLAGHPAVNQVAVLAREDQPGQQHLVAYVVAAEGQPVTGGQLKEFAAVRLPDYMVPAAVVSLPALPLTPSGKLDRKALPAPDFAGLVSGREPQTPVEEVLCRLFAETLHLERVGADDNFFDLGGDSIVSMQLVAGARRSGLVITPRQVFEQKTPAGLALVATGDLADGPAVPEDGVGEVPLTPVMHWVAERVGLTGLAGRFSQSVSAVVPGDLDEGRLAAAARALVDHHDVLRAKLFCPDENDVASWRLTVPPAGVAVGPLVRRIDARGMSDDEFAELQRTEGRSAAGRLDPRNGVMVQVVWLDWGPEAAGRVLLVVHHLAVDGVSWRVLLPDLAAAYAAVSAGDKVKLEPVGTSFRRWALAAQAQAEDPARVEELPVWQRMLADAEPLLGDRQLDPARDTAASMRRISMPVSPEVTAALLTSVPAAFHAGINDVLLTGLAAAVGEWRQRRGDEPGPVLVEMEGHGREPLAEDMDLSRTVGWFTSVYPVRLETGGADFADLRAGGDTAGEVLKRVKEQVRAVPGDALGYGLLRYLNATTRRVLAALPTPQIGFNYMGRFGTAAPGDDRSAAWRQAGMGGDVDEQAPAGHVLEAGGVVREGPSSPELSVSLSWPDALLDECAVRELAEAWVAMLTGLAEHAAKPGAGGHSPSDFPLVPLAQEHVTELEAADPGLTEVWPLSPLQEGLLFHAMFDEQAIDVYSGQRVVNLDGPLDSAALRAAGQSLLDRHANLRAGFRQLPGLEQAVQVVVDHVTLPWREVDLSALTEDEAQAQAVRLAAEELGRRFDPAVPPLVRLMLIKFGKRRHRLLITNHHLVLDGWSLPILKRELFEMYGADGEAHKLPPVTSYGEYLRWLARQDRDAARQAWRQELAEADEPTLVAEGGQWREPAVPEHAEVAVEPAVSDALRAFARGHGLTLNTVVQGAWAMVVSRLAGRDDVVFGAVVAGRPPELAGVEDMLGLFVNTVPVRVPLDPARPVSELLADLQDRQSALLAYQYLGLAEIQRAAGAGAGFDTLVVYESYPRDPVAAAGSGEDALRIIPGGTEEAAHYPVSLTVIPREPLRLRVDCRPDAFDRQTAAELADRLVRVLGAIVADPAARVGQIGVLDEVERFRVVSEWNGTEVEVPDVTVPALFEARVVESPDAVALVFEGRRVSYAELDVAVNGLAWRLIGLGVGPEKIVAVAVPRSVELLVALLAVLKAGGAYLPVDADFPASRLGLMFEDAGPVVVLCTAETVGVIPDTGVACVLVDDPGVVAGQPVVSPERRVGSDSPAYVIYTSGSTGVPKGVMVPHVGMVNRLLWMQGEYGLGAGDRVLQKTPSGFDVSVWEFFWPLIVGAGLVVARPGGHRDPRYLAELIVEQRVTTVHFVPSMLRLFLDEESAVSCTGLVRVVCSGEALPGELVERFQALLPDVELHNLYGPTEASVDVSYWGCRPGTTGVVPIGAPIWNTRLYVLDAFLQPVPAGVVGELYIAGVGLARGYLNRRGLTGERFVAGVFGGPGERMYRTGDLARWTGDGQLVYVGRVDAQVKVRGLRIELGEIEAVLAVHPTVGQVAVLAREDQPGQQHLVAYVVPAEDESADSAELREFAGVRLPDYMVPAAVVPLQGLPLTPSGKLDRKALPAPDFAGLATGREPQTPVEKVLCRLFAETLHLERVGADDNFFDLGGDSIVSMQLVARARRSGLVITPRQVFEQKTPAGLALVATADLAHGPAVLDDGAGELPLTPVMHWAAERAGLAGLRRFSLSILAVVPAGLDLEHLRTAVAALVAHHDVLRTRLVAPDEHDIGTWRLDIPPAEEETPDPVRRVDAVGLSDDELAALVATEGREAAGRLAPSAGVVLQAVWLDRGLETAGRVLLVAHHLVVDGVSLRVLLPDLAAAYAAMASEAPVELEPVGTSFRRWALLAAAQASNPVRLGELPAWQRMLTLDEELIGGRPLDPARDTAAGMRRIGLSLSSEVTSELLTSVPTAFHAGINDVLLAGFAAAAGEWRRRRGGRPGPVLVDLEGHGREPLADDVELSRTVGWFTDIHPVRLDPGAVDFAQVRAGGDAAGRVIKQVKEQLRAVPGDGLGHGFLRYLNPATRGSLTALATPQIIFNYMGRLAVGASPADGDDWRPVGFGGDTGDMPAAYALEAGGIVRDGPAGPELSVQLSWPGTLMDEAEVRELGEEWVAMLTGLAEHAARPEAGGHTPSDFPLLALAQDDLDVVAAELRNGANSGKTTKSTKDMDERRAR